MQKLKICVGKERITLSELRGVYERSVSVTLAATCYAAIKDSRQVIEAILKRGKTVYGVNTGFGLLAKTKIAAEQLMALQKNLVLSHSTGVGAQLDENTVRLVLFLKIFSLSRGYSGVRPQVVDTLIAFLEHDITPCIPAKGSVGASGDLAPLAHMSAALMGIGEVLYKNKITLTVDALEDAKLEALVLEPKEGLALLNGTQVSTALALAALFKTENLFAAAMVSGAMSVDAMKGSDAPFDPRIHGVRGQIGQMRTAEKYVALLQGSDIRASHFDCDRVQDPYSLRCQPQVMGACLDLISYVSNILRIEANAVTDNPLVFSSSEIDGGDVISGGNFHAEPVAFAADTLALAIAEIGALSERRLALLVDPNMSGLPAFLVNNSGVNSGFMIAQVSAAALASENKTYAHPASIDSLPTSANQEDHVSMATFAARRLHDMIENSNGIIAIELLAAAQGIEFHAPHMTSVALQKVITRIREEISFYSEDRFFAPDINKAINILNSGFFRTFMQDLLPSHEKG